MPVYDLAVGSYQTLTIYQETDNTVRATTRRRCIQGICEFDLPNDLSNWNARHRNSILSLQPFLGVGRRVN